MYLLAPYATIVLGTDFQASVSVLQLGCVLPIIQSVHVIAGNYLTAIGRQSTKTLIQFSTLLLYTALGVLIIPFYSWPGAIFCALASESFLAIAIGCCCFYYTKIERKASNLLATNDLDLSDANPFAIKVTS